MASTAPDVVPNTTSPSVTATVESTGLPAANVQGGAVLDVQGGHRPGAVADVGDGVHHRGLGTDGRTGRVAPRLGQEFRVIAHDVEVPCLVVRLVAGVQTAVTRGRPLVRDVDDRGRRSSGRPARGREGGHTEQVRVRHGQGPVERALRSGGRGQCGLPPDADGDRLTGSEAGADHPDGGPRRHPVGTPGGRQVRSGGEIAHGEARSGRARDRGIGGDVGQTVRAGR